VAEAESQDMKARVKPTEQSPVEPNTEVQVRTTEESEKTVWTAKEANW